MATKKHHIKVGFLISYDYKFAYDAVAIVYDYADEIILAIDAERTTWSGSKFEIGDDFFDIIRSMDPEGKITFYEENFYIPANAPMQNEIRERSLLSEKMGKDCWKLQIDIDEYFTDFPTVYKFLQKHRYFLSSPELNPINIRANWITLFKQTENGFLYIPHKDEFSFATNLTGKYAIGRNIELPQERILDTDFPVIHQSWARDPEEIHQKISNWGHKNDFDTEKYFEFWNSVSETNYKSVRNFHPIHPENWKKLEFMEAGSITDFLKKYNMSHPKAESIKVPSIFLKTYLKNLINFPGRKKQYASLAEDTVQNRQEVPAFEKGINVLGYLDGEFGLGEAARLNIKAIMAAGIPVSLSNYEVTTSHRHNDKTFSDFSSDFPYGINLIQISPAEVRNLMAYKDAPKLENRYNILYAAWESEHFPEEYVKNISFFDEIWVPSKYCQDVISRVSRVPVITIPHPVVHADVTQDHPAALAFYDPSKFNFLFIFDYNSSAERKNIYGLITAFEKAFGRNDARVALHIKTSLSTRFAAEKAKLVSRTGEFSNVSITEKIFDKQVLDAIIAKCDCYVSLHRAEGFGLTMAEAMYFGRPVIGTGYSGNMEFMDFQNSFLVKYAMSKVGVDLHNYDKNTIWSDPDTDDAARLMRFVWENPSEASAIAKNGMQNVHENLSFDKIGSLIKQRLEFISGLSNVDRSANELLALEMRFEKIYKELKKIKKSGLIMTILNAKESFRNFKQLYRKKKA